MILLSIRDIIEQIAQKYGLDTWDWIAFAITFTTFLVSSVSLIVACKTLKSQKKTEQNTRPNITIQSQKSLLKDLMQDILESYTYLLALQYQLIKKDYNVVPSEQFWQVFPDTNDYLYESLFYSNEETEEDSERFLYFKKFSNECKRYKNNIENLRGYILSGNKYIIENEFKNLYIQSERLGSLLIDVCCRSLGLNENEAKTMLQRIFPVELPLGIIFEEYDEKTVKDIFSDIDETLKYQLAELNLSLDKGFNDTFFDVYLDNKQLKWKYNDYGERYELYDFIRIRYYTICSIMVHSQVTFYNNKPFFDELQNDKNIPSDRNYYYLYDRDYLELI